MRVDGALPLPENLQTENVASRASSAQPGFSSASIASSEDQAQLTVGGGILQQLRATLSQVPEIRQGRVDALRQAVGAGTYQISDQQLSDAIGSEMLAGQLRLT
jgi:flagellar biosynthesis anti-sigma factor FlgM